MDPVKELGTFEDDPNFALISLCRSLPMIIVGTWNYLLEVGSDK